MSCESVASQSSGRDEWPILCEQGISESVVEWVAYVCVTRSPSVVKDQYCECTWKSQPDGCQLACTAHYPPLRLFPSPSKKGDQSSITPDRPMIRTSGTFAVSEPEPAMRYAILAPSLVVWYCVAAILDSTVLLVAFIVCVCVVSVSSSMDAPLLLHLARPHRQLDSTPHFFAHARESRTRRSAATRAERASRRPVGGRRCGASDSFDHYTLPI